MLGKKASLKTMLSELKKHQVIVIIVVYTYVCLCTCVFRRSSFHTIANSISMFAQCLPVSGTRRSST